MQKHVHDDDHPTTGNNFYELVLALVDRMSEWEWGKIGWVLLVGLCTFGPILYEILAGIFHWH